MRYRSMRKCHIERYSRRVRAEEPVDGRRRGEVLMDGELALHRRAAVAEPALVARPGVDTRVDRLLRPRHVPWALPRRFLLAPGSVGDQAGLEAPLAVVPGIHVEHLRGIARPHAGDPCLVEGIGAQEVVAGRIEPGQVSA